ncbi:MAG: 4Fe-4S dicluster domain-containing protein [bacterium]
MSKKLVVPLTVGAAFWALALAGWLASGQVFVLVNFGYIGTSVALGLGLYAVLPRAKKPLGRRIAQFLVGVYMLGFLGLLGAENMQIEGLFYYLLAGVFAGAVIHYAVAKIIGPLFFGRAWCGWACWTAMVLDLLPWKTPGRRDMGRLGHLRYLVFGLSLLLILVLWYVFGYRMGSRTASLAWLLGGNALYYGTGVGLAWRFKDNRAFCKILCPVAVPLKVGSRYSLLKVRGNAEACTGCGTCSRACPMGVDAHAFIQAGSRVLSTECTVCQTCVSSCPNEALKLSFGVDTRRRLHTPERRRGLPGAV